MAPVVTPINMYLREQTVENCSFLSVPYARVSLVVAKESLGGFQAIAVKAENGRREAILSESGANVLEALQRLFLRSAEAVQHHITARGFDLVAESEDDDSGSESDSASKARADDDGGDGFSTDESLSDNETVSVASRTKATSRKGRKLREAPPRALPIRATTRRQHSRSRSRSRSRSPSLSSSARSRSVSSSRMRSPDGAVRWHARSHNHNVYTFAPPHPGSGPQMRQPHLHAPWRSQPNLHRQQQQQPCVSRMPAPLNNPHTWHPSVNKAGHGTNPIRRTYPNVNTNTANVNASCTNYPPVFTFPPPPPPPLAATAPTASTTTSNAGQPTPPSSSPSASSSSSPSPTSPNAVPNHAPHPSPWGLKLAFPPSSSEIVHVCQPSNNAPKPSTAATAPPRDIRLVVRVVQRFVGTNSNGSGGHPTGTTAATHLKGKEEPQQRQRIHYRRTLEQVASLGVRAIQSAALAYVRRNAADFLLFPEGVDGGSPYSRRFVDGQGTGTAPGHVSWAWQHARAAVRKVVVGENEYDVSGYKGMDLTGLVDSHSSGSGSGSGKGSSSAGGVVIPLFEVDVEIPLVSSVSVAARPVSSGLPPPGAAAFGPASSSSPSSHLGRGSGMATAAGAVAGAAASELSLDETSSERYIQRLQQHVHQQRLQRHVQQQQQQQRLASATPPTMG